VRRWKIFLSLLSPTLISAFFVFLPIEDVVSAYPVPRSFTWYIPWRGALVALALWLATGFLYSDKRYYLKLAFLGSAISFIAYHYMVLFFVSGVTRVTLLPLFYLVGDPSPLFLDLGQVVALATAAAFRRELSRLLSGGTSPRTA